VERLAIGILRGAILPVVAGTLFGHERVLPQRAANCGEGGWVGAGRPRVDSRIAFGEDVEARAAVWVRVTLLLVEVGIEGLEEEAEIGSCTARAGVALESAGIALGSWRLAGLVGERLEGIEAFYGVWCGFRTVAIYGKISPPILRHKPVRTYFSESTISFCD